MLTLRLGAILIVFLSVLSFQPIPSRTSPSNGAAISFEESLPEFPPGATVILSDVGPASNEKVPINRVFLKRIEVNADQTVWTCFKWRSTFGNG
ncbi:MAG: hypothetical protein V7638_3975 [Acidobacteriota bacterium]|jgi:hypothetical protein